MTNMLCASSQVNRDLGDDDQSLFFLSGMGSRSLSVCRDHRSAERMMLGSAFHEFEHDGGSSRIRVDFRLCLQSCLAALLAGSTGMRLVSSSPDG